MTSKSEKNKRFYKSNQKTDLSKNTAVSESVLSIAEQSQRITSLTETNRQLKRKIFDLYTIVEISRNFNAVLDYETLLETFILTSIAQVGATKAALFLSENITSKKMKLLVSKGQPDFKKKDLYFKVDSELLTHLARLNRPEPTEKIYSEIATEQEKKVLKNFQSGLVVPLIYQGRISGLFIIADKISGREFQLDDIEFLSILGSQISVAIENARLYKAEKMATSKLIDAQGQLVNSERLAALGEMSAKVAHEINNPLGIIKNYILLIKRTIEENPEALDYSNIVGHEIDRIAQIVRELLEFHRPTGFDYKLINPIDIIEDVLHLMEQQFDKQKITLSRNFINDCPRIEASFENLKQVFMNLILNSVDVMEGGGSLTLSVGQAEQSLVFQVCDTGSGIPEEIIPRIFEPFFTTKDPGKGTGLGLSVCYGIIKRHKGTITYKNRQEGGGCFEIVIPIPESEL